MRNAKYTPLEKSEKPAPVEPVAAPAEPVKLVVAVVEEKPKAAPAKKAAAKKPRG